MSKFSNINPAEIAKFTDIAKHWWDPNGATGGLHAINHLRIGFITSKLTLANRKVLDIGCGGGILTEALAKAGAMVTGIDLAEALLDIAKQHAKKERLNIDYRFKSIENMAEEHGGEFDVVTCMEMLEHVPDPSKVVKACAQLIKPEGNIFFSTINRNLQSYLFAIIVAEYILRLLPKRTHAYSKLIRPVELEKWGHENGLSLIRISGLTYQPLTKAFKLCNNTNVNYITHFIRT